MIDAAIATTPQSVTAIAKSTSFGFSRIRRRIFANRFSISALHGDTATRPALFPEVPRDRWAQKQPDVRRISTAFQPRSVTRHVSLRRTKVGEPVVEVFERQRRDFLQMMRTARSQFYFAVQQFEPSNARARNSRGLILQVCAVCDREYLTAKTFFM